MENIDIKDFRSVSAVNDTDNILLARSGGSHGKMLVSLFKQAVIEGLSPNIRDGVWSVGEKNLNVQADGKTPVLETGTGSTLEPGSDATFSVVPNGVDSSGNPVYKVNAGIPEGIPGDGSGNVNVTNGVSLETGKQYAFKPQAAGSVMGTFVEVEASRSVDITDIYNRIAEADNGGTVSEEDFNTLKGYIEAGSTLYVNNDGNGCLVNYIYSSGFYLIIYLPYSTSGLMYNIIYISEERRITVTGKIVPFMDIISNMNLNDYEKPSSYSPISSTDSIQSAIGKLEYKVTEEGGFDDTYWLDSNQIIGLSSGATHEEILNALGGDIEPITNAVIAGKKVFIRYNLVDSICLTIPVSAYVGVTGVIRFLFTYPNAGYMIDLLCSTTAPAQSYVKIIYLSGYTLDGSFATLTQESDSQAISDAVGGE